MLPDHNTYSLEFLQSDWDGAGFDFEFASLFNADKLNRHSLGTLIRSIKKKVTNISLKYLSDNSPEQWQSHENSEIEHFLEDQFEWETTRWLVLNIETKHGFAGEVGFVSPDQVTFSGPAENFFSGNLTTDLQRVRDLMNLAQDVVRILGEGHGCFGPGAQPLKEAFQRRANKSAPNLTTTTDFETLSSQIAAQLQELRLNEN
ncbi:hypothetical protein Pan110_60570 [Gimesia panareensis]|nr:hypothetical protein Pan110_60570 [Gimesia panareensis]